MGDVEYAIYRREDQILPAPASRFSVPIEFYIGKRATLEEALLFASATCDHRVFVREVPKTDNRRRMIEAMRSHASSGLRHMTPELLESWATILETNA